MSALKAVMRRVHGAGSEIIAVAIWSTYISVDTTLAIGPGRQQVGTIDH